MYNAHWYCEDMYWPPPELQNSQSEWKLKIQFLNVFVKVKVQTFLLWKIWNVCVGNVDGEMAPSGLTGKSAFAFCDSRWEASEKFRRQIIVFFLQMCVCQERCLYMYPLSPSEFPSFFPKYGKTPSHNHMWGRVMSSYMKSEADHWSGK